MSSSKKVVILHEAFSSDITEDEQDTLVQSATISATLKKLGYSPVIIPVTLDLARLARELKQAAPFLVFNLVESLEGQNRFLHFVPALLEELNVAFTGSGENALFLTTNKPLSKQLMLQSGVITPDWSMFSDINHHTPPLSLPLIIKPVREDASRDISDTSVILSDEQYADICTGLSNLTRRNYFLEGYVEGREINVSLLSNHGRPEALPPSEILFEQYPDAKPHIVNYNAKWCPDTFEYRHTPRKFDFKSADRPLVSRLKKIACKCWECFGLQGYARVDFRVDENNKPWVIDVNANPCLSPDSGFVVTAITAGYTYEGIITRILDEACFYSPFSRLNRMV